VSESSPADAAWEALEEATRPETWRRNYCRVAGVLSEAADRDVARRFQAMEMRVRLAAGSGGPSADMLLPLDPAPATEEIQAARERFADVDRRFLDEFFWFGWAATGGKDAALDALRRGDEDSATAAWLARESASADAGAALHETGLLHLVRALDIEDLEQRGRLRKGAAADRWKRWDQVRTVWPRIEAHDPFWTRVAARIARLDDPRLPPSYADVLRRDVARVVMTLEARVAVRAAERGQVGNARRHVKGLNEWADARPRGASPALEPAMRTALEVTRKRLDSLVCGVEPVATPADLESRLFRPAGELLAIVDVVLPSGHALRTADHDRVADAARSCLLRLSEEDDVDWDAIGEAVETALGIAEGDALRKRLTQDVASSRKAAKTAEQVRAFTRCWFCDERDGEEDLRVSVPMYGDLEPSKETLDSPLGERSVSYRKVEIQVPRCRVCRDAHDLEEAYERRVSKHEELVADCRRAAAGTETDADRTRDVWATVGGVLTSIAALAVILALGVEWPGWACLVLVALAGEPGAILLRRLVEKGVARRATRDAAEYQAPPPPVPPDLSGTRSRREAHSHPAVREQSNRGWKLGTEPTESEVRAVLGPRRDRDPLSAFDPDALFRSHSKRR
jgi:hypothetical protein